MKCFDISIDDKDLEYANWNKTQVLYECCGIHDYTYWGPSIPYSCCIHPQITNCSANISNVYQKGCLQNINIFVNDQVRFQTSNAQLYCLTVGVVLLVIGLIALYFSRKIYCGDFICVEPERMNEVQGNEYEPILGNDGESEGLVGNRASSSYMAINNDPRDTSQVHVKNSSDDTGDDEFFDSRFYV